ncbi:hypothetical protein H696_03103 [Fonticula alba]|uniref:Ras-GAP domain-containing protein n=1 Tax=Fonticula alba TaxID=691883 RepID=A0A058ZBE9_FONAL|nr:hypothetical protein H696_03103 [Fonticula alba]KCV70752.1 hypothetical protein H696_03103 [Fonticula alba]|eukprot:XP_009495268.1 hypothetical protein H696_03103 [Fonticula alba]
MSVTLIDPNDVLLDSPTYRVMVSEIENSNQQFSESLTALQALTQRVVNLEKETILAYQDFHRELTNLVHTCCASGTDSDEDTTILDAFSRFGEIAQLIMRNKDDLVVSLEKSLLGYCNAMIQQEFSPLETLKSNVQAHCNTYETEVNRLASWNHSKRLKDSKKIPDLLRKIRFSHSDYYATSLEYIDLLNYIHSTRRHTLLQAVVKYWDSLDTYHSSAYAALSDHSEYVASVSMELQQVNHEVEQERTTQAQRRQRFLDTGLRAFERYITPTHTYLDHLKQAVGHLNRGTAEGVDLPSVGLEKGGYLFKRGSGAIRHWNRRFFQINLHDYRLEYISPRNNEPTTVVAVYLRGATVRAVDVMDDRGYVFEVHSAPSGAGSSTISYYLQALTEGDMYEWLFALTRAIKLAEMTLGKPESDPAGSALRRSASIASQSSTATAQSSESRMIERPEDHVYYKIGDLFVNRPTGSGGARRRLTGRARPAILGGSSGSQASLDVGSNWRLVNASITKEGRLELFEYDKGGPTGSGGDTGSLSSFTGLTIRRPPSVLTPSPSSPQLPSSALAAAGAAGSAEAGSDSMAARATRPVAAVDLSQLKRYSIAYVHDSITTRRNVFSISTQDKGTLLLSGYSPNDRDDWVLNMKTFLPAREVYGKEDLRAYSTLYVDVREARNLPSGEYYCEIFLGNEMVGVTSRSQRVTSPFWGESFVFHDIPEIEGVTFVLRSHQRLTRDAEIARVTISDEDLHPESNARTADAAMRCLPFSLSGGAAGGASGGPAGELRASARILPLTILPVAEYDEMLDHLYNKADPQTFFALARAPEQLEHVAVNLTRIHQARGKATEWLISICVHEVLNADTLNTLFRGNSLATKAVDYFMKLVGFEYLDSTLGPIIRDICAKPQNNYEMDPQKLSNPDDARKNFEKVEKLVNTVWTAIYQSRSRCPYELRVLFNSLQLASIERFGSETVSANGNAPRYSVVSAFIFLRLFCAAILTPKLFGLVSDHPADRPRRTLMLVAKTIQTMANIGSFDVKEAYMQPLNSFLQDNTHGMMDFIDYVSKLDNIGPSIEASVTYPIDLALEAAHLHDFVSSYTKEFRKAGLPRLTELLSITDKLTAELRRRNQVSLMDFLNSSN